MSEEIQSIARRLCTQGKGVLAIDETPGTIHSRLVAEGIVGGEPDDRESAEMRARYRELLCTAPGIEDHIGGAILVDETFVQTIGGKTVPDLLNERGIIPGIKVDRKTHPLPGGHAGEKYTQGFDGLEKRLIFYKDNGAGFCKWRAVFSIGGETPSRACIAVNTRHLALYAALCQSARLVPIVEPEVLMDGSHDINRCREVTEEVLATLFSELRLLGVDLRGMLLKPNMVVPGAGCEGAADARTVAEQTLDCLRKVVDPAVPGIVFLSGGQTADEATENLNAINQLSDSDPWRLSFSFGRALQNEALKQWAGQDDHVKAAQLALLDRSRACGLASSGSLPQPG